MRAFPFNDDICTKDARKLLVTKYRDKLFQVFTFYKKYEKYILGICSYSNDKIAFPVKKAHVKPSNFIHDLRSMTLDFYWNSNPRNRTSIKEFVKYESDHT